VAQGLDCRLLNQEQKVKFLADPKTPFFATETSDMLQLKHSFLWY